MISYEFFRFNGFTKRSIELIKASSIYDYFYVRLNDYYIEVVSKEPTVFQNMINLVFLDLSSNSIRSLDSKIFSCNKRLKNLSINCEITN